MKVLLFHHEDINREGKEASSITNYVRGVLRHYRSGYHGPIETLDCRDAGPVPQTKLLGIIPLATARILWRLARSRREICRRYDLLWVQNWQYVLPFLGSRIRIVLTIHGSGEFTQQAYRGKKARLLFHLASERIAFRRASRVILVSRDALEYYRAKYPGRMDKVDFIPTFYDEEAYYRDPPQPGRGHRPGDKKTVLYAGRLVREKRVDLIIRMFQALARTREDCRLLIAGRGAMEDELQALAREGGPGGIEFLGGRSAAELRQLYNQADATVLLSEFEGTPLVMLESLACGTPVFSTRVGDIGHIIKNNYNGWLADPAPPEVLARQLSDLLDLSPRLSDNAVRSAEQYTSKTVSARIMRSIESAPA